MLSLALYALGSGLIGAWLLVRWLSLPPVEQPAFMVLVGSRTAPTRRAPDGGAGDGFYVFRSDPKSGELCPVAQLPVTAPNLASMCAIRESPRSGRGGYSVHVACEADEAGGGVASVNFNPQRSPCIEEAGGVELCPCHVSSLGGDAKSARFVACSQSGLVTVLAPTFEKPRWRYPSTWRAPPTGALHAEFAFSVGGAKEGVRSASMALPVLAPAVPGKQAASFIAVADPVGEALLVCQLVDGGRVVGKLQLRAGSQPSALAVHPNGRLVYLLCEGEASLLVVQVSDSAPPKQLHRLSLRREGRAGPSAAAYQQSAPTERPSIIVSRDGAFVYAVACAFDGIAVVGIKDEGKKIAMLSHVPIHAAETADEATKALDVACSLALVGDAEDLLLIACPIAHRVLSYRRDLATGQLQAADAAVCPSPLTLLGLPWPPT